MGFGRYERIAATETLMPLTQEASCLWMKSGGRLSVFGLSLLFTIQ